MSSSRWIPATARSWRWSACPAIDNNLFAKGVTTEAWNALTSNPDHPMFNQAIGGQYPPGSIFKPIVASAGLQEGVINSQTLLGDGFDGANDGIIWLPNQYLPWRSQQGSDLRLLERQTGLRLWHDQRHEGAGRLGRHLLLPVGRRLPGHLPRAGDLERLDYYAGQFGLGATTGIELPGRGHAGWCPIEKWKRLNYAEPWLTGDTYNMSIGQGFVLATPLQMANATAAIANRGYPVPAAAGRSHHRRRGQGRAALPAECSSARCPLTRRTSISSARACTGPSTGRKAPHRTCGCRASRLRARRAPPSTSVTGTRTANPTKTQRAICPRMPGSRPLRPYADPEIVVTVFVANGGEGSSVAAPVAAKILRAYFGIETPRQRHRSATDRRRPRQPQSRQSERDMRQIFWRRFDWLLLALALLLSGFGVLMVASALSGNEVLASWPWRQAAFLGHRARAALPDRRSSTTGCCHP